MEATRTWTNSTFGRVVTVAFSVVMLGISAVVEPNTGPRWAPSQIATMAVMDALVILLLIAIFTSRLTLRDGVLTATQLGRSRSVLLAEVASVKPGFWLISGLLIRTRDGRTMRTLVSGEVGNEFWTTRAQRLCDELEALSRGEVVVEPVEPAPWRWRSILTWTMLITGWGVATVAAAWWADSQSIGWALDESSAGPNYLLVTALVYWLTVACFVMVRWSRVGSEGRHRRK